MSETGCAKAPPPALLKREYRLTRSTDFQRVRHAGESYAHPLLVLIALKNQLDTTRIGVAAGRSVGGAVQRNRAKRVLRAAAISLLPRVQPGWDLLLLARRPLVGKKVPATKNALRGLLEQAGLLAEHASDL